MIMRRALLITASSLSLAACSGFSLPSFDLPMFQSPPPAATVEFESEPPGAEVKTTTGQTCRTPCSLSVTARDQTATFTLAGYQPQTVPMRLSTETTDQEIGQAPSPRVTPNPVSVELQQAPQVKKRPPAPAPAKKPRVAPKPKPPAQTMAPAPAPAPASPWPTPAPTTTTPPAR
jgi:hypothetical protein